MPHFADMVYQLGGIPALAGIPFGPLASYFFVDATNGSDSNDGRSLDKAKATLAAAEDLTTAGRHDTVFIVGTSLNRLSAALTWDHSYTHLIGICAPTRVAQRARIFQLSTLTSASPLLDITASGCIFKNFYIYQGVDDAGSLIDVQVTGHRNYFENVHFAGGGHATQAINGGASLKLNAARENTFVNCTIGIDTIEAGTGMTAITFDGSATRNIFENCLINLWISHTNAVLVELVDAASVDRYTIFRHCDFFSNSTNKATAMASAFVIPSGHTTTASILLRDCAGLGFTDWDADGRGIVYLSGGTATAGTHTGLYQVATV